MVRSIILSLILMMGVLSVLRAQDLASDTIKADDLDEVVVVASRKPTRIAEIPGTVWVVPKVKLKEFVASGIPIKEMLGQLVPSMDIGAQGRTNFGQNMRGRAMLVMIDGVSLNSLRGVSRQLDAIDPFHIERIEVLSGASSIYGGNATGGIINIITKKTNKQGLGGETTLGLRSGFNGGHDHDYRVGQSLSYKNDKFDGRLGISYQQNGGTFDADGDQIFTDITQTDLQYNRVIDVMGSAAYQFNHKHKLSIMLQYYNSEYNGDRALSLGTNFGAVFKGDPKLVTMKDGFSSDKKIGTRRYMGILSYRANRILGGQDLHIQVASRGEELGFYPFPGILSFGGKKIPLTSSSEQNTYYTGVKAVLSKKWNSLNLTYGLDFDFEDFEAFRNIYDVKKALSSGGLVNETFKTKGRYPNIFSQTYAAYVQAKFEVSPQLTLNGGLRHQFMDVEVDDFIGTTEQEFLAFGIGKTADPVPGGSSSYGVTLANFGLLFKPVENLQVWGTFSQGAQLADPAKLYGVGTYSYNKATANWDLKKSINIGDTSLEGILTNQFELGYRTKIKGFKAQIAGFLSKSEKNIGLKTDKKGNLFIQVEDLKLRNMGIEMKASYDMGNGLYFGASTLLIKSQIKQNGDWKKQSIFTASPSKVVSYIGYNRDRWALRFQNQQTLNLKDNDDSEIKGYNISDCSLSYNSDFGKFSLGIQNLFNADYQTIWSHRAEKLYGKSLPVAGLFHYNGRGRTFNLSYVFEF